MNHRTIVLVSNKVYHYRVSIYNYLARRLAAKGFELVVITNELQSDNPHPPEFRLHQIPFGTAAYRKLITAENPAAVMLFLHIRDYFVWPLLWWLKRTGRKVIYWNHGINLETPNNPIKRVVFSLFHLSADAIVLYSANEKRFIARRHHRKVFVANNTLNFADFPDVPQSKSELRAKFGIYFDKVVLFVGRITPAKKLDDLLAAVPYLADGTGVVVVGGGLSDSQRAAIDESDNILYLGEIYDSLTINQIFKLADVFCIPGKMGLGINQAFFWGLPAITERVNHSPEIVYLKEGVNGYQVAKDDPEALADKINSLLGSPLDLENFSQAARDEILRNGSIDRMCDGFIEAIEYLE